MIRVNLLPPEYRKAEATPLKQFFATVGAAVLVAMTVVGWLYVRFAVVAPKAKELETVSEEVKTQAGQVKQSKDLAGWLQEYMTQYEKIDKVCEARLVASRKLDEFWETVVNPNPPGRYEVWLTNLAFTVAPSAKSGGTVQFAGTSAGPQVAKISDFNESITTSELYGDFQDITFPWGSRVQLSKGREPAEGWTFNWSLTLRPLKELYEARVKAAQEAAGGGKK